MRQDQKIPYLTLIQYNSLYEQFLADEQKDIGSSEIVLGDSYYESSVKTVFEYILLTHIKNSGVLHFSGTEEVLPEYTYCETEECKSDSHEEIKHLSADEFLKEVFALAHWYEKINFEEMIRETQFHYANALIFLANAVLKEKNLGQKFIHKTSYLETRAENARAGDKKING